MKYADESSVKEENRNGTSNEVQRFETIHIKVG